MNIPTFGFWFFDELSPLIGWGKPTIQLETPNYGAFKVKASSLRLECLVSNNRCVTCGKIGVLWQLQAHHCYIQNGQVQLRETPHLNLYAIENDSLILMTRDHIIPRAKGGLDILDNLQTMCAFCNQSKGDTFHLTHRIQEVSFYYHKKRKHSNAQ